uniref:Uncharacterized protein n=1 Tax=Rhizophora mucronata TaxID=61149 RepID=A0A2P2MJP2_RHIMU
MNIGMRRQFLLFFPVLILRHQPGKNCEHLGYDLLELGRSLRKIKHFLNKSWVKEEWVCDIQISTQPQN